eukprot:m.438918 g.438918  ORF g.438918 m.438918 type:complete len:210 (-) comp18303_c0_seq1:248-877(-)
MALIKTLAIVKPDAVDQADEIVERAKRAGFAVLNRRRVRMSPEAVSELYNDSAQTEYFSKLIAFMSGGPCEVMVLANGNSTVSDWLEFIGPEDPVDAIERQPDSIRALYGNTDPEFEALRVKNLQNAVHGSLTVSAAAREIRFFFPDEVVEPLPTAEMSQKYINEKINPTLIKGLTALSKAKPADPLRFLADWLDENNPNQPVVEEPDN